MCDIDRFNCAILTGQGVRYFPVTVCELTDLHRILEHHLEAILELDLVHYYEEDYFADEEEMRSVWINNSPPQTLGHFELTELGERFVSELKKENS